MYITFSQQIISKLQVVIGGQKNNFIGKFKLKPITITIYNLLRKCCEKCYGYNTSFFTIPLFLVVVSSRIRFYYFILTCKDTSTILKILC